MIIFILILVLFLLSVYFYKKENFLTKSKYSFLGLDEKKGLNFYNSFDNKFYKINSPKNESIVNFLYDNTFLIVLTKSNKIYYCDNYNLMKNPVQWTIVSFIITGKIKKIALDFDNGNDLFVLMDDGKLYMTRIFNKNTIQIISPVDENAFIDFDARFSKIIAIGKKTNLIYQTDIIPNQNFSNLSWKVLDKNEHLSKTITITMYGYIGQDKNNKIYLCNEYNNYKWTLINLNILPSKSIITSINSNSNAISLSVNNKSTYYLYVFNETKTNIIEQLEQISLNKKKFNPVKVIDYIFPKLKKDPEIIAVNTKNMLAYTDTIQNNDTIGKYQKTQNLLNNIQTNIKKFYLNQINFNDTLLKNKINERNNIINSFKKNIGFKENIELKKKKNIKLKEKFEDIFHKINNKLTVPQPTEIVNGIVKKKIVGEDLVINYP